MSGTDKPEALGDGDLDAATGGTTQNDLDNGRLVSLVGVAPTKPAEYVVLKAGQADTTSDGDRFQSSASGSPNV